MLGLGDIVGLVVLYVSVTGLMGANCVASLLKLFPANAGAVLCYVWLRVRAGEGRAVRPPEPAHRP
ncbi:hypothetical protein TZ03_11580 [Pseudomonas sp. 10-1B]|nr:hypothetical protein TZ03_11580 [Pseudomonas sp. 10-1B]